MHNHIEEGNKKQNSKPPGLVTRNVELKHSTGLRIVSALYETMTAIIRPLESSGRALWVSADKESLANIHPVWNSIRISLHALLLLA